MLLLRVWEVLKELGSCEEVALWPVRQSFSSSTIVASLLLFCSLQSPSQQPGTNEFVCKPQSLHVPRYNGNDLA